jgi:nonsense-mediated mRNA decay protein 3
LSDFGKNDRTFIINTHLGEILNFNDTVLAYDLDALNVNELEELDMKKDIPPVVIVKKTYPKFRKRQKHRLWKLKHLEKEEGEDNRKDKKMNEKNQRDYDNFI